MRLINGEGEFGGDVVGGVAQEELIVALLDLPCVGVLVVECEGADGDGDLDLLLSTFGDEDFGEAFEFLWGALDTAVELTDVSLDDLFAIT